MARGARGLLRRQDTEPGGELSGERHSECNRLAVEEPIRKSRRRFQCMPEGMAEIEKGTITGFAFVAGDDCGLHPATRRDRMLAPRAAGEHVLHVGFEPGE